jgi:hypothetical protein
VEDGKLLEQEQPKSHRQVAPAQHDARSRYGFRPLNAYELLADETFRPELEGKERYEACGVIAEWIPEVME